jgi:TonB family protein
VPRRRGEGPGGAAPEARRVYTLAEVAEPPSIADACPAVRALARSYPPILWDQGKTVTVVLSLVAGRDGAAREVSVARSSGYARVDAIARSVAEQFRFAPARAAGAPVDVRVEVPVEFSVASQYPRVVVR